MQQRRVWTFFAALLTAALLAGGAAAQASSEPGTSRIKKYEAEPEKKKEAPKPATFDVPRAGDGAQSLSEDKREAQILVLTELIEMKDDADPEKPELFLRMADLYAEKAFAYESKANDIALERRILEARDAGRVTEATRYERERDSYVRKQEEWQLKAIDLYRQIEANYPTYPDLDRVLYHLAFSLNVIDQGDEALGYYVRLATEHPESRYLPDALYNVGDYYFDENEFANAIVFYEKVGNFPESRVYGLSLFKQGWCYYNLQNYERAFESFLAVIRYTDQLESQGKEVPLRLKEEAEGDLVLVYSHVGTATKALPFFKKVSPTGYLALGARLAELYTDQGKFDDSSRLLQTIIREDPDSHRVLTYQRLIVSNAEKRGDKGQTAKEADRLIGLYKKIAATAPEDFLDDEKKKLDELLRVMSTNHHAEYERFENEESLALAERLYGVYVEIFPTAADAYDMRHNYGILLFQQKKYAEAVVEFEQVIAMNPQGQHTPDSAYMALLCYYQLITISGADDKGFDETELTEKEVPALEQKMVAACDRFVEIESAAMKPDEDAIAAARQRLAEAKFAAAKILYDFNRFKDAVPRFRDIVLNHGDHKSARDAARLLLSSYHLTRDIRNLNRWAEQLAGMPHLVTGELAGIIRRIRDRAEYNTCFVFEGDKRYKRAAECFLVYTTTFPSSELLDKALYFAAANFDKAHLMERSIETFVELYNKQRSSPLAPAALFAVGKVYHHAVVYDEAARYYEIYADKYPKGKFTEEALRYASIFRRSLGDYDLAITNLDTYLRLFPKQDNAPQIYFDIGVIHEKKRDWSKATEHFKSYLRKYGKKGPLDLDLLARLKIAQALARYKGERQQKQAMEEYEKLVTYFDKLPEERLKTGTLVGIAAVAEARFEMGERILERGLAIRISSKNLESAMKEKLEVLGEADRIFQDVYSFEHPQWQIAALNRVGVAFADLADAIEEAPIPKELTEEQKIIYQQDNAIRADKIRERAVEMFRKCLETAREQQWFNRFSDDAEQRLAQIDTTYQFTKEFRARPVHTSTGAYPPAFLFADDREDEETLTP